MVIQYRLLNALRTEVHPAVYCQILSELPKDRLRFLCQHIMSAGMCIFALLCLHRAEFVKIACNPM